MIDQQVLVFEISYISVQVGLGKVKKVRYSTLIMDKILLHIRMVG